ncbi:Srp68p [Sugiyamaella lignohabitans]|uniref:Signal recognition particle subunit SRP68 n=1 Tax=Sugiyamaella lignohabitans TaxID=796027 RepID=A0A167DII6_9ASCO|nr:Srp68p [Sugiyamaella lignohabitans]ANB12954.1 Srp68p [Sugiyamaella lignohabitans]
MEQPFESILIARSSSILLQSANDLRSYRLKTVGSLAKVRRDLKIQQKTPKGTGQGHGSEGKSLYKQKTVTAEDLESNSKIGNVLLLLAEASWAHAMETKAISEANASASRTRRVVSKLAKAVNYATTLSENVKDLASISDLTKFEIYIYQSLIEGALRFEQHQWAKSVQLYSTARVLLVEFLNNTKTEKLERSRELINDLISTTVDPALGFAVYKTGHKRSTDLPTLAKLSVDKESLAIKLLLEKFNPTALEVADASNPSVLLGKITWRNHSASVIDPDLATQIIAAQDLDGKLQNELDAAKLKSATSFDATLQGWQDALDLIKESIDKFETSSKNQTHDQSQQDQYVILTYISYNLLLRRIQRDRLFVEQLSNKKSSSKSVSSQLTSYRDVVRIYETILQSVSQLIELPGVHNDETFSNALDVVNRFFKAQRTFLIAKSYRLVGDQKKESLSLFELASKFISSEDAQVITGADLPSGLLSVDEVETFVKDLKAELVRAHGIAAFEALSNQNSNSSHSSLLSVSDDLTKYPSGSPSEIVRNLVNFKPHVQPVPVKPVFFDIAFNYIDYDDDSKKAVLTAEPSEPASATPSAPGSGASTPRRGFFGALLGRS